MNEQHLDALPPVTPNQQAASQEQQKGGELPASAAPPNPAGSGLPPVVLMNDPSAQAPYDPVSAAVAGAGAPAIADDVDLIEKEWVEKAKQIVEQTKGDPYQQNEAMTKMKTDYLKKRYNREVKPREDA